MSIASRAFLAATLAAGLMVSGGAHAAQGFSIDLGDPTDPLTLDWSAAGGLSAEVAASNGQPAQELPNNGSYKTTLTGNYDVVDDLGSLDKTKPVLWRESWELTLNGHVIFDIAGDIVPSTGEDIFDYIYNTLNQPVGTFALGTTESLGERIALFPTNTLSVSFSAFVVPEPSTWAMLLMGFAGLGFVGYRRTRRAKPQAA